MASLNDSNTENIGITLNCDSLSIKFYQDFPQNQEAWDELVESTNSGIYLTYDWCQSWWAHYGLDRSLRIFLIYDVKTNQLVGVMPMFIDNIRVGLQKFCFAKTIGADFTIGTCEAPILKDWIDQSFEAIISELMNNDGCDAVLLGPMISNKNNMLAYQGANYMNGLVKLIVCHSKRPHTIFECPKTFEDYTKNLGKSTRKSYRNWWNRLCKNYDIAEDVISSPFSDEGGFMDFIEMHTAQWKQDGKLGHFGDWPFAEKFHVDLVNKQANRGRFFLFRILSSNKVISYQYMYICGKTLHWMLPARVFDSELERLSLGRLSLVRMLNWAISEGITHVDAGAGHYPYKLQLGAKEFERQSLLIVRNRVGALWRCWIFRFQGTLLNIFYYKIWYLRVAPKLHIQQPLWKSWIQRQLF